MNKDWVGNKKSTFVTLGASSHSETPRQEHDYYAWFIWEKDYKGKPEIVWL